MMHTLRRTMHRRTSFSASSKGIAGSEAEKTSACRVLIYGTNSRNFFELCSVHKRMTADHTLGYSRVLTKIALQLLVLFREGLHVSAPSIA